VAAVQTFDASLPHFGSVPQRAGELQLEAPAPVRFDAREGRRHMSSKKSAISNVSERLAETGELLEDAIGVALLAGALVFITCVVALFAAFTFAVLHNGDDFNFGHGSDFGGSGGGSDIIVLPAQPF
jgi:hypothetical protein